MTSIIKAKIEDYQILANIGKASFIESHGHSASKADIDGYVNRTYSSQAFKDELNNPKNIYYIIYHNNEPAGFSKIIYDVTHPNLKVEHVTEMVRFYLLRNFYGLGLGLQLFNFNVQLSKQNNQKGMWLFVWKENQKAIRFYKKVGFKIIGEHNYKISETHYNPNHQLLLVY